ncbi:katanin p60 ATPase-containing subunit A-like 2 [Tripterygium wilfordii]|uniref:Katanin p60 ATPase-containing subunit A-like 2 n=1 Tax=Tripterygium wilfordii TaxID=458696 RepID=A0A7J7CWD5_TRIWF|nr:katanin p60 ATPase-containing subunit A-like 2 [Tripterygium wilfordii]
MTIMETTTMMMFVCEKEVCLLCAGCEEECVEKFKRGCRGEFARAEQRTIFFLSFECEAFTLGLRLSVNSVARNILIPHGAKACDCDFLLKVSVERYVHGVMECVVEGVRGEIEGFIRSVISKLPSENVLTLFIDEEKAFKIRLQNGQQIVGTGKSSLIAAMANYLKFDIYGLQQANVKCDDVLRRLLAGGVQNAASNYLEIKDDHRLYGEIEGLQEDMEVTPAQVAEEIEEQQSLILHLKDW